MTVAHFGTAEHQGGLRPWRCTISVPYLHKAVAPSAGGHAANERNSPLRDKGIFFMGAGLRCTRARPPHSGGMHDNTLSTSGRRRQHGPLPVLQPPARGGQEGHSADAVQHDVREHKRGGVQPVVPRALPDAGVLRPAAVRSPHARDPCRRARACPCARRCWRRRRFWVLVLVRTCHAVRSGLGAGPRARSVTQRASGAAVRCVAAR